MPSAPFVLSLLGGIELHGVDESSSRLLVHSKVVSLLAFLAVPAVGRFARRDTLVGMLWPELDQVRARTALRKAVHEIRSVLGAEAVLSRGDEDLALSAAVVECDASTFTAAADSGFLLQALQLYRGELMPGFHLTNCLEFDQWLETERANARERASAVAWALAHRFEGDNQLSDAAGMVRRAIQFSWSDERALRRALAMLERVGDRAGAMRLYDEFARRLKADFETTPSPDTLDLVERMRSGARA